MNRPFVSVVTPVYNGAQYLSECIESVLAQVYEPFEYIIINNCSTDSTLEIAKAYEKRDRRIKVLTNSQFVGVIENHNIAFRSISINSEYCKVVSADDWIYPECITKLVELAESNPRIGVVQSYAINGKGIRSYGLAHDVSVINGREVCRLNLLGKVDFAAPSALLYRSSLIRAKDPFFPGSAPSADAAACLECLDKCDFGCVHQILSFERIHAQSVTAKIIDLDSYLLDRMNILLTYGPVFLSEQELAVRLKDAWNEYYSMLAASVVNFREKPFWAYHQKRLKEEFGRSVYGADLSKAAALKLIDLVLNPKQTVEKVIRRVM